MYLSGSIMTFALPFGAFIAAALALYFLFRTDHATPKLKYLTPGHDASVATREPHPAPVPHPSVVAAGPETAVVPGALPPDTPLSETPVPEGDGGEA